jgi:hypothetical protein
LWCLSKRIHYKRENVENYFIGWKQNNFRAIDFGNRIRDRGLVKWRQVGMNLALAIVGDLFLLVVPSSVMEEFT